MIQCDVFKCEQTKSGKYKLTCLCDEGIIVIASDIPFKKGDTISVRSVYGFNEYGYSRVLLQRDPQCE